MEKHRQMPKNALGMSGLLMQYQKDSREDSGRGLGLLSNALQVVTEALGSSSNLPSFIQQDVMREQSTTTTSDSRRRNDTYNEDEDDEDDEDDDDHDEQDDIDEDIVQENEIPADVKQPFQMIASQHPNLVGKTIVASDNDVTNGFVKDGKMLPYVFEANEAGVRKRASKILPVCGVCGKRFVCVTTMKRHLVTHTGEKPFSCKVCGKQYTQKGNLRVHERTHRNDRPFECNICHQKFYRKEPMQKHQWRQHGVVHFKSRPLPVAAATNGNNNSCPVITTTAQEQLNNQPLLPQNPQPQSSDNAIYSSIVEHISSQHHQNDQQADKAKCLIRPMSEIVVAAAAVASRSPLPPVAHLLNASPLRREVVLDTRLDAAPSPNRAILFRFSPLSSSPCPLPATPIYQQQNRHEDVVAQDRAPSEMFPETTPVVSASSTAPIKLRMKFAYQQEQHDMESATTMNVSTVSGQEIDHEDEDDYDGIPNNLNELKLRSSSSSPVEDRSTSDARSSTSGSTSGGSPDSFQCVGCCTIFAHKPALKAHQICPEDRERPFKCCKCGYKFRQKAHLQKHQWRIHRRRYCEQDEVTTSQSGTTITMQDIINHGVETSLREMPVVRGKTSSKYYSEILGLEYDAQADSRQVSGSLSSRSNNDVQPLDLSPIKKKVENDSTDTKTATTITTTLPLFKMNELENNPLLNQPPSSLPQLPSVQLSPQHGSLTPVTSLISSSTVPFSTPAWKKQRTEQEPLAAKTVSPPTPTPSTHRTLPPISILQKPSVLSLLTRKPEPLSSPGSFKHTSWIRDPAVNPVATDLSLDKKFVSQDYLREQIFRNQGGRTV